MTPAERFLQTLEGCGSLDYTERQVDRLGQDVRDASAQCQALGYLSATWVNERDENDQNIRRVTWSITPKGIARMDELRAIPNEPQENG